MLVSNPSCAFTLICMGGVQQSVVRSSMLSKVNDFILEAWLLPLMYPGTPWCRLFILRILADRGFRGPVAVGASPVPSALAPQS